MTRKLFKMDVVSIILIVLCLLNLSVCVFLSQREDLEIVQKVAQIIIVWFVPFLGALGLYVFHRSQDKDVSKPFKGKFGGGDNGRPPRSKHTTSNNKQASKDTTGSCGGSTQELLPASSSTW